MTTGFTVRASNPGTEVQTIYGTHPSLLFNGNRRSFRDLKLITHLHLEPRLRMNGTTPLLPFVFLHDVDGKNFYLYNTTQNYARYRELYLICCMGNIKYNFRITTLYNERSWDENDSIDTV
jgi:hypothetical protein